MSVNPLQQYFRRPAVYLKLPSGGIGYPEGSLDLPESGEIPIYPMTAIDEITSKTPDSLFNGSAIVDIIHSCAPNIKDPWAVTNVDLDPLLVSIRMATHGSTMEIETTCPECSEEAKYDVNLTGILSGFKSGDYTKILNLTDNLSIKFKPMRYKEINEVGMKQFQMQQMIANVNSIQDMEERAKKTSDMMYTINQIAVEVIASTIEYVKVPEATVFEKDFIVEFLQKCDKQSFDKVRDYSIKLRESSENKPLKITCMHCNHEYEQTFTINPVDFFG